MSPTDAALVSSNSVRVGQKIKKQKQTKHKYSQLDFSPSDYFNFGLIHNCHIFVKQTKNCFLDHYIMKKSKKILQQSFKKHWKLSKNSRNRGKRKPREVLWESVAHFYSTANYAGVKTIATRLYYFFKSQFILFCHHGINLFFQHLIFEKY